MTKVLTDQRSIRIKGRSFLAVVLSPEAPVDQWLERLDDLAARSAGFFLSRPVVLDVSELSLDKAGLKEKPRTSGEIRAVVQSLVINEPVRSGQSIMFPEGDVTVIGSVASGAEIIAGGSIHVYGALRGRAMAGSLGNVSARIFCRKLEAELLAIDGVYKVAEDIDDKLRGQPVQLWLEDDTIKAAKLG